LLRDTELTGFLVRVTASGHKSFCLEKRIKGRNVRKTIGRYPDISPERARRQAHIWLGLLAEGKNPFQEDDDRAREALTVKRVFEDYLKARKSLKPNTVKDYRQMIDRAFRDWRNRPLQDISKAMVQQRHAWLGRRNGPHYANNALRLLRALYNYAAAAYDNPEGQPLISANPVSVLTHTRAWYPKKRRRSVITRSQLPAWYGAVLDLRNQLKNPKKPEDGKDPEAALVSDYLLLLIFTGLRKNEAATLRWDHVSFADKTLTISDTKNGDPLTLPLSDYLIELLENRHSEAKGEFVFPGPGKHGHLIEPKRHVGRVIKSSGIKFMLHDLRRTFITVAESLDLSHYAIKRLVNHRMTGDVTAGYVVANVERLRAPMQRITDELLAIAKTEDESDQFQVAAQS
jgi:integrase